MTPLYTVIIPALNEEAGIGAVLDRVKALQPAPAVIVVDDGSSDRTGDIAREKGATVIRHPAPAGYGRSLKDGIRVATTDIIAATDADGTYPIERIPELVGLVEKGFDMAVGARQGKHYRGAFLKMPARIVFKWIVEFTTGTRIPDINSGLRAFRKADVLAFEDDLCNGFSFTTTITLIEILIGKFVTYLPIDYGARVGRSKVKIIRDSLRTLQYITEVIATYNPMKIYAPMAGLLGFLALLSLIEFFAVAEMAFLLFFAVYLTGALVVFGMGVQAHIKARAARMKN